MCVCVCGGSKSNKKDKNRNDIAALRGSSDGEAAPTTLTALRDSLKTFLSLLSLGYKRPFVRLKYSMGGMVETTKLKSRAKTARYWRSRIFCSFI